MNTSIDSEVSQGTGKELIAAEFAADYFPFFLAISRDLEILGTGPSLRKIQPHIEKTSFADGLVKFESKAPIVSFEQMVAAKNHSLKMHVGIDGMHITGRFQSVDSHDVLYFLGSPVIENFKLIKSLGLNEEDYTMHESRFANSRLLSKQIEERAEHLMVKRLRGLGDVLLRFRSDGIIYRAHVTRDDYMPMSTEELIGTSIFDLVPQTAKAVEELNNDDSTSSVQIFEYQQKNQDETLHFNVRVLRTDDNRFAFTARDITDNSRIKQQLNHLANHDELTGLANRRGFHTRLSEAIEKIQERHEPYALLLIDLDDFKVINDTHGHKIGDQVLQITAKTLSNCLRKEDMAARLGGDEFAILLENTPDEMDVERLAHRFIKSLRLAGQEFPKNVNLSATIGIVMPSDEDTMDDVMRAVDLALYEAKSKGKNQFAWFCPDLRSEHIERKTLALYIREAIDNNHFVMGYQPIIELETGDVQGFDAVARWHHKEIGWIRPEIFIRAAEEYDLIAELSSHLFDIACADVAWAHKQTNSEYHFQLNFNISTVELCRAGLAQRLLETLSMHEITASSITLEITESALLDNFVVANHELEILKSRGMSVALDDFGHGYSSLSHLTRLPFDIVKIDKSFIGALGDPTKNVKVGLVAAVIGLQDTLGISACAEGIETRTQMEMLKTMDCAYGQGYLIALPGDRNQIVQFLKTQPSNHVIRHA